MRKTRSVSDNFATPMKINVWGTEPKPHLSKSEALAMYRCVMLNGFKLRDFLNRLSNAWEIDVEAYQKHIENEIPPQ